MDRETSMERAKSQVLQAALPHVAFDGWSEISLAEAIADSGVEPGLARALFPRGGVDLAVAYHRMGDAAMTEAVAGRDLAALRFRDRIALAIRLRLEAADKELVRRGSALFSLPQHMIEGAADLGNCGRHLDGVGRSLTRLELVFQTRQPLCRLWRDGALLARRHLRW